MLITDASYTEFLSYLGTVARQLAHEYTGPVHAHGRTPSWRGKRGLRASSAVAEAPRRLAARTAKGKFILPTAHRME